MEQKGLENITVEIGGRLLIVQCVMSDQRHVLLVFVRWQISDVS